MNILLAANGQTDGSHSDYSADLRVVQSSSRRKNNRKRIAIVCSYIHLINLFSSVSSSSSNIQTF